MKKIFYVVCGILLIFNSAGAVSVNIEPSEILLTQPVTAFQADVRIEDASDLGHFEVELKYDPALVSIDNESRVVLGDFISSTGRDIIVMGPVIDNGQGIIDIGAFSLGSNPGANGAGTLASITFTVHGKWDGTLSLSKVSLAGADGVEFSPDIIGNASILWEETHVGLDIDGDGNAGALTDGLLILSYLFGFRGTAMTADGAFIGTGATHTDPAVLESILDTFNFDIDGNGKANPLTDGVLIWRHLFGFTGTALIDGAVASGCVFCTADQITAVLTGL